MWKTARNLIASAVSLAALTGALVLAPFSLASAEESASSAVDKGKMVSMDRKKGNCIACHMMDDGALPGNIGPPLISMKLRFPDKAKLREQIWDSTRTNPNTIMPPFGRHRMLSEEEIDNIVEYIYTL